VVPWDVLETLLNQLPSETKKAPDLHGEGHCFVSGVENGQKVEYHVIFRESDALRNKYRAKGCYGLFRTGIFIAIAAVMLGRGEIKAKGVLHPEIAVPPDSFLEKVAKEGFEVEISRKVVL